MIGVREESKLPNWVYSTLTVRGSKADLKRFKTYAEDKNLKKRDGDYQVLSTSKFMPYPKKYADLDKQPTTRIQKDHDGHTRRVKDEDGYNHGGYEWCCKHWGTKWGLCDTSLDKPEGNTLNYHFQTAWSPAFPLIFKMSKMFPNLEFEYFCDEESRAFVFEYTFKKGKVIKKIDHDPDTYYPEEEE